MNHFELTDKKAFVTGAGSGLGQAIAIAYAQAGADVACLDIGSSKGIDETVRLIGALGRTAIALEGDVTDPDSVDRAFAKAEDALGPVDIAATVRASSMSLLLNICPGRNICG